MAFDEHGNFVRRPNVDTRREKEAKREKARIANEEKCIEYILKRLLTGPVEVAVLWNELEPYDEVRREVIGNMISWAIIRREKINHYPRKATIVYRLNITHDFLTKPSSKYYYPEIAKASQAALDELRKRTSSP